MLHFVNRALLALKMRCVIIQRGLFEPSPSDVIIRLLLRRWLQQKRGHGRRVTVFIPLLLPEQRYALVDAQRVFMRDWGGWRRALQPAHP